MIEETKQEYINRVSKMERKELLCSCRMVGLSCHKLKSNMKIAEKLWISKEYIKKSSYQERKR